MDIAECKKAVDELCELMNSERPANLLVDVRTIKMDMSKDEQIYFGKCLAAKKELAAAKVALVHVPASNPNKLINAISYTEGYEVVDFDNINCANDWLLGNLR